MRRREVVAYAAAALALARSSRTQAAEAKRVGVLIQGGPHHAGVAGLREGLKLAGLQDVVLDVRNGGGDLAMLEGAATDLERKGVDLLVAFSTSVSVGAKRATNAVPLVFAAGSDPVAFGLVESIPRPGGRSTGLHSVIADVTGKRFELLRELMPNLRRVLTFYNPTNPISTAALASAQDAAGALGVELLARRASSPDEVRARLADLKAGEAEAFFFVNDAMILSQDASVVERATALRMGTMAYELDVVIRGALAGYGLNYREFGRLAAKYVARILSGTDPRDLPVEAVRPSLAINLKTASALGVPIPPTLLARADEVVE